MKKMGGALQALVWLLFTISVGFGSTIYYFEAIASWTTADVTALLLWGCVILLLFVLAIFLCQWAGRVPGFFQLGDRAALALETICCVILTAGGIYLRIGQEFVAFWSEQGANPLVEAAYVTSAGLTESWPDLLSRAYVYLLNQLFLLTGNLNLAAAGMQLVLFCICCFLLYFLVRRVWGPFCACICLGGLMLFPEMIRVSMYCSPEILLILGTVVLGWVLHLCFDRFLEEGYEAALDLLLLVWFLAGCMYYQSSQQWETSEFLFSERVLAVGTQTALLAGLVSLVLFLFIRREAKKTAAIYMLMAVIVLAVQMMGMQADAGCRAALSVVMQILLGITLQELLMSGDPDEEEKMEPAENEESEKIKLSNEPAEIFIPKSMEIPARKRKAKIDFDKDISEEEMKFDLEIRDEEEFDQ